MILQKLIKSWMTPKPTVIVVMGPTASGKTSTAIALAKEIKEKKSTECEIISADSRQVYKEIPIFSGAVAEEETETIPHYLVGSQKIGTPLSAGWFREQSLRRIDDIHARGKIPIVAGGSSFWIQSILFRDDYPKVEVNQDLRQALEGLSVEDLQTKLQSLDPKRFSDIDIDNPRRLIRSIEIATELGNVPEMKFTPSNKYNFIVVYFDLEKELLASRIAQNVVNRFSQGLEEEARSVYETVSKKSFSELGLAYKHIEDYWGGVLNKEELIKKTTQEEVRYAKRQKTFFKKLVTRLSTPVFTISKLEDKNLIIKKVAKRV